MCYLKQFTKWPLTLCKEASKDGPRTLVAEFGTNTLLRALHSVFVNKWPGVDRQKRETEIGPSTIDCFCLICLLNGS